VPEPRRYSRPDRIGRGVSSCENLEGHLGELSHRCGRSPYVYESVCSYSAASRIPDDHAAGSCLGGSQFLFMLFIWGATLLSSVDDCIPLSLLFVFFLVCICMLVILTVGDITLMF